MKQEIRGSQKGMIGVSCLLYKITRMHLPGYDSLLLAYSIKHYPLSTYLLYTLLESHCTYKQTYKGYQKMITP